MLDLVRERETRGVSFRCHQPILAFRFFLFLLSSFSSSPQLLVLSTCLLPAYLAFAFVQRTELSFLMAKGIRSKCKRAARTELRKVLSIPLMKKQTERAVHALTEGLKQKQQDTLTGLRKVLVAQKPKKGASSSSSSSSSSSAAGEDEAAAAAADEEDDDDVEMGANEISAPKSNAAAAKEAFIKRKGSKPRNNPGKEMVWF